MNLREILEDVALNFVAGFEDEIANAMKADAALIRSRPALKNSGAEIAAAILGRPRTATGYMPRHTPIPAELIDVYSATERPQVIDVEPLRRLQ